MLCVSDCVVYEQKMYINKLIQLSVCNFQTQTSCPVLMNFFRFR